MTSKLTQYDYTYQSNNGFLVFFDPQDIGVHTRIVPLSVLVTEL